MYLKNLIQKDLLKKKKNIFPKHEIENVAKYLKIEFGGDPAILPNCKISSSPSDFSSPRLDLGLRLGALVSVSGTSSWGPSSVPDFVLSPINIYYINIKIQSLSLERAESFYRSKNLLLLIRIHCICSIVSVTLDY